MVLVNKQVFSNLQFYPKGQFRKQTFLSQVTIAPMGLYCNVFFGVHLCNINILVIYNLTEFYPKLPEV